MVLKFGSDPDEIFFIEATSNQGVALKRFSGMKYTIGSFYKKIVLRHLDWERPDSSLDVLEQFINEVQGNQYSFSLRQLKKRNTINLSKDPGLFSASEVSTRDGSQSITSAEGRSQARLVEEGRAFFCSELVAKAYKVCGIMQYTEEACANFLPCDWQSSKQTV